MSLKFRTEDLTPGEASLIAWQFGYHDDDDMFLQSLWTTIRRAWESDNALARPGQAKTEHLRRLGSPGAFPDEVAVYLKFKSPEGEKYWLDMLKRAGLADRRKTRSTNHPPEKERRRANT